MDLHIDLNRLLFETVLKWWVGILAVGLAVFYGVWRSSRRTE